MNSAVVDAGTESSLIRNTPIPRWIRWIPSASTPLQFLLVLVVSVHPGSASRFLLIPYQHAASAGAVGTVSAMAGIVFSGFSDNSLTSRVSAIDACYTTTGDVAIFTTNSLARFLFVQVVLPTWLSGLADDNALTAGGAEINISGSVMGFGD